MSTSYVIGDKVMLKSGGPVMTVEIVVDQWGTGIGQDASKNTYMCQWFAGKKLERANFPHDSLDLVP